MDTNLTPFQVVERLIGRPETVDRALGLAGKTSYSWRGGSANRDVGDIPSTRWMRALLAYSAARGIPLQAEHLIWGAPAAEIEELLRESAEAPPNAAARTAAE